MLVIVFGQFRRHSRTLKSLLHGSFGVRLPRKTLDQECIRNNQIWGLHCIRTKQKLESQRVIK